MELPIDVVKLEQHFQKPPKLHNDDRQKRSIIVSLQQLDACDHQCYSADIIYKADISCAHGIKRYQITGEVGKKLCQYKQQKSTENNVEDHMNSRDDLSALVSEIGSLSLSDVNFLHLYSEGLSITVADLILFAYTYFLLVSTQYVMNNMFFHFQERKIVVVSNNDMEKSYKTTGMLTKS